MVGSSHIVLRKVTKVKLEIKLFNLKKDRIAFATMLQKIGISNGDPHLLYNAQLYH